MNGIRLAGTVGVAGLFLGAIAAYPRPEPLPQPSPAAAKVLPAPVARYQTVSHTVSEGDTAGGILRRLGAEAFLRAAGNKLDRLSVGDRIHLDTRDGEGAPWRLRLEHGSAQMVSVERAGERFVASAIPVPYTIRDGAVKLVVEEGGSLWQAANDAGLDEGAILAFAKIYEFDVDFNTEILPGATIRAVAENLVGDDGTERYGDIRAAELVNGKKTYTAIRYTQKDGTVGWYGPDGKGRRKGFLRSPLAFSRVTSGFNLKRFHPIAKTTRPHYGVDFGAPTGTPVRAVADGVVVSAGKHGGHGNYVELDHEGPYGTSYSHLSAILVKKGQKVKQGDLVGRVGSTGFSTGPHLHYQFTVGGKFVNPMTVDLPASAGELPAAEKAEFEKVRDAVLPLLSG
ncbi:MAG: peptidoglycan DD-metalloendopeptidase family protein [Myxococcota bacterium]